MKRRGKKRAIVAIAPMILTAIYQMLSTGEAWNPSDLYKIEHLKSCHILTAQISAPLFGCPLLSFTLIPPNCHNSKLIWQEMDVQEKIWRKTIHYDEKGRIKITYNKNDIKK